MTTALYIGRFQPFHKGHLEYIKIILKECDRIKIVIGSSQEHSTLKNPLTSLERRKIIADCLSDNGIDLKSVKFYFKRDIPGDDVAWLRSLNHVVGKYDKVYAGENLHVKMIFEKAGYLTNSIKRIKDISGTNIRKKIIRGEDWKTLVPQSVYSSLKKLNGEEKIKSSS